MALLIAPLSVLRHVIPVLLGTNTFSIIVSFPQNWPLYHCVIQSLSLSGYILSVEISITTPAFSCLVFVCLIFLLSTCLCLWNVFLVNIQIGLAFSSTITISDISRKVLIYLATIPVGKFKPTTFVCVFSQSHLFLHFSAPFLPASACCVF